MRSFSGSVWMSTTLAALMSIGCEASPDDESALALEAESLLDAGLAQPSGDEGDAGLPTEEDAGHDASVEPDAGPRPDPDLATIIDVTANGTGCRDGSWKASLSPDGTNLMVTFLEFEAWLERGRSIDVADCLISVRLRNPRGLSFAVTGSSLNGYAMLDEGYTAFATTKYYFQGSPVGASENRTNLSGPFDDDYLLHDRVRTADATWSPCGVERLLQIQTRLQVRREEGTPATGTAYINLEKFAGLGLAWRRC